MTAQDQGGDPPCWAHMFEDDPLVVDLGSSVSGSGGAIWSLPHGGDLDANLVRLAPGGGIGEHLNDEVDVLMFVQSGSGDVTINGQEHSLGSDHLVVVPRGTRRSISAGSSGITYLSVHRRRDGLGISARPPKEATP